MAEGTTNQGLELEGRGSAIQFPFSSTPGFQQGTEDYRALTQYGRSVDGRTGERYTKGLMGHTGETIRWIPAGVPEDYVVNVRDLLSRSNTNPNDLVSIKKQMTGFGRAALDRSDLRTALLAFEVAGALENPQIKQAISEAFKIADDQARKAYAHTRVEIVERKVTTGRTTQEKSQNVQSMTRQERPRRISIPKEPEIVDDLSIYRDNLVEIQHTGSGKIYILGGPDGRSIVKFIESQYDSRQITRLMEEIRYLKTAKGAGGLPILEAVIQDRGVNVPRGIQIERILGDSLYGHGVIDRMTPANFGLDNRLWLIYDLVDAYEATGVFHGDVFGFLKRTGDELEISVNKDNLILERSTNRIRMIDYGLSNYDVTYIDNLKDEIGAAIEFLFMGRAKVLTVGPRRVLPTNPNLQAVGQEMLTKLESVQSVDQIRSIIPRAVRLPGEKH